MRGMGKEENLSRRIEAELKGLKENLQLIQWAAVSTCLGPTSVPVHPKPLFHIRPITL